MVRIDAGRPTVSPANHEAAVHEAAVHEAVDRPSEADADGAGEDAPKNTSRDGSKDRQPDERPLATGRLDVPCGFPFEGNAHILVLSAAPDRRDVTVDLLRRDGDAGWEVDAAGTPATVRAKLALETFAVVVLFTDHADLAPREVIRVIESTRRWPSPAVIVIPHEAPDQSEADALSAQDLDVFQVLSPDPADASIVEAVREGVSRDSVRARPRWETDPG